MNHLFFHSHVYVFLPFCKFLCYLFSLVTYIFRYTNRWFTNARLQVDIYIIYDIYLYDIFKHMYVCFLYLQEQSTSQNARTLLQPRNTRDIKHARTPTQDCECQNSWTQKHNIFKTWFHAWTFNFHTILRFTHNSFSVRHEKWSCNLTARTVLRRNRWLVAHRRCEWLQSTRHKFPRTIKQNIVWLEVWIETCLLLQVLTVTQQAPPKSVHLKDCASVAE